MLPDVVAATILSPLPARQAQTAARRRAIRLEPQGLQTGLHSVGCAAASSIDPTSEDPFVRMIEERQRVQADESLSEEERERLQLFLKITANATAYGVLARFDRREHAAPPRVTIYGPDPEPSEWPVRGPGGPWPLLLPAGRRRDHRRRPSDARPTRAARPRRRRPLRLLRHRLHGHRRHPRRPQHPLRNRRRHDTDPRTELPRKSTKSALASTHLNPYDPALVPSPWKSRSRQPEPAAPLLRDQRQTLLPLPQRHDGEPEIVAAVDTSEDTDHRQRAHRPRRRARRLVRTRARPLPRPDLQRPRPPPPRQEGRRLWVAEAWQWILADARGQQPSLPAWADRYALTRFTISSPHLESWFKGYNHEPPPDGRRSGPGASASSPTPPASSAARRPTRRPYETNPERWANLDWYDRRTGNPIRVTTYDADDDPEQRRHSMHARRRPNPSTPRHPPRLPAAP